MNSYMQKSQDIYTQYSYNKYIRINDRFFTYYNKDHIKGSFRWCLYKVLLFIFMAPIISRIFGKYSESKSQDYEKDRESIYYILLAGGIFCISSLYFI